MLLPSFWESQPYYYQSDRKGRKHLSVTSIKGMHLIFSPRKVPPSDRGPKKTRNGGGRSGWIFFLLNVDSFHVSRGKKKVCL